MPQWGWHLYLNLRYLGRYRFVRIHRLGAGDGLTGAVPVLRGAGVLSVAAVQFPAKRDAPGLAGSSHFP